MAKKRIVKKPAWNKGLEVGQKDAFTPAQVKRIRQVLADRGVPGPRELALFSTAIDTMMHGHTKEAFYFDFSLISCRASSAASAKSQALKATDFRLCTGERQP
jgi:hypothetical protein